MDGSGGLSLPDSADTGTNTRNRLLNMIRIARSVDNPPKIMFAVGGWFVIFVCKIETTMKNE